jgi:hypothetical protein
MPSSLETIDSAILDYVDGKLNISTYSNEGFKKVPVIWATSEKSYQIKKDPELRDTDNALILPLISVKRDSVEKDANFKGGFQAHFPDGDPTKRITIPIARRIVQDRSAEFLNNDLKKIFNSDELREGSFGLQSYLNAFNTGNNSSSITSLRNPRLTSKPKTKNKKVIYQTMYAPIPVYIKVMYSIVLKSNYQTQMNDMMIPFATKTGQINSFSVSRDGHRYEVFVESSFSSNNNVNNDTEERYFQSEIKFRVLGYLMGEGSNNEKPKISIVENAVEFKFPIERLITG